MVIKKNWTKELYDRTKLKRSILLAFAKRPVDEDTIETVLNNLEISWQSAWTEVTSKKIWDDVLSALKDIDNEAVALIGGVFEDKPSLCVMLPQSLVDSKKMDAGAMVREAAKEIQGGGGGQKTLATAGGKNAAGIDKAIEVLKNYLK